MLNWIKTLLGSQPNHVPANVQHSVPTDVVDMTGPGLFLLEVVGESHYQDALESIAGGRGAEGHDLEVEALLILDEANPYDDQAVRIDVQGHTVGYLSRERAREYRQELAAANFHGRTGACRAKIVGGWDRGCGDTGSFGLRLDIGTRRNTNDTGPIQGELGYHSLVEWWLEDFSGEERDYIEQKYRPMVVGDTDERPLTRGEILESSHRPAQMLSGLSTWFKSSQDLHIARRILVKAEQIAEDNIMDLHFVYSEMIPVYYRHRDEDPEALDLAISACEKQIALGPQAASAWRAEYPTDDSLPSHRGFEQLAIIREKQRDFVAAIQLASDAQDQGWSGDWTKRIARCEKRRDR